MYDISVSEAGDFMISSFRQRFVPFTVREEGQEIWVDDTLCCRVEFVVFRDLNNSILIFPVLHDNADLRRRYETPVSQLIFHQIQSFS